MASEYDPLISVSAAKYGIDPDWLRKLLVQENGLKPTGTSPAGAQGIAQFMPGTAARYGVNVNDPASSIDGAAHYLSDNLKMFGGNQGLATAAYNWGEGNVQKWMKSGGSVPEETRNYVSSITGKPITSWVGAGGASSRSPITPPSAPPSTPAAGTTLTSTAPPQSWLAQHFPGLATEQGQQQFEQKAKQTEKDITGKGEDQKTPEAPPFQLTPMTHNVPGQAGVAAQAAQMMPMTTGYQPTGYGTLLNSPGLQVGPAPPQPPAWAQGQGLQQPQAPGTSLNSLMAYAQGYPYAGQFLQGFGGYYGQ